MANEMHYDEQLSRIRWPHTPLGHLQWVVCIAALLVHQQCPQMGLSGPFSSITESKPALPPRPSQERKLISRHLT